MNVPVSEDSRADADAGATARGFACPTCRRRIEETALCPRCGTELDQLHRLRQASERGRCLGWQHLLTGDAAQAVEAFDAALRRRDTPEARRGRAVALAAAGRFGEALEELRRREPR